MRRPHRNHRGRRWKHRAYEGERSISLGRHPAPDGRAFDGYDYQSHFASLPSGRMHYVDEGTGDPVVMLHGVPTWSYLWRDVIPFVASTNRTLAPDLLNHGRSDENTSYAFLDHYGTFEAFMLSLDLRDVVLVLHDWGASVGFL